MSAARPDRRPVGVVVVSWNSAAVLPGLLDSLEAGMQQLDWHLVIVDNGSTDPTVEIARGFDGARLIELDHNVGFAAALNRGLATVDPSSDVFLLNPDVRLTPASGSTLQGQLAAAAKDGRRDRPGVVAPVLIDESGTLQPSLRHEPSIPRALAETLIGVRAAGRRGWGETVLDPAAYERATTTDWVSGAALMISRECLDACGAWDESFFLYSEDAEYALRARDHGFRTCLVPDCTVTHLGGNSRTDPSLWTLLTLNKVVLHRKRHGHLRSLGFRVAALLRELRFAAAGNTPSRLAARALLTGAVPER